MLISHVLSLKINLRIRCGGKELIILKNAFCRNVDTAILKICRLNYLIFEYEKHMVQKLHQHMPEHTAAVF